jgi:dUTP pyrophosphatase
MIDLGISVSAYDEVYGKHRHPYILPPSAATPLALFLIVRSSTGKKTPLRQANAPGLIDQGYRGHLMAAVDNISHEPFRAEEGARYFQLMACDGIPFDEVQLVDALSVTERSTGGFGSTGE